MEVIAEPQCSGVELLLLLGRTELDVLVLQAEQARVPGLSQVFTEYPRLTVLTLGPDRLEIRLHHLKIRSVALTPVPPDRVSPARAQGWLLGLVRQ
jgi:hypothetical protein